MDLYWMIHLPPTVKHVCVRLISGFFIKRGSDCAFLSVSLCLCDRLASCPECILLLTLKALLSDPEHEKVAVQNKWMDASQ